ncbi:MAG TPA: hypothetical protein VD931_07020 [Baekduia sp.]|nr:hypothetical protein [Baekduia sp.]
MTTRTRLTTLCAASLTAASVGAAPASAAPLDLGGDQTMLRLDSRTAKALGALGVAVRPIQGARTTSSGIAFPITGGRLDTATAAGRVTHSGGLRLRAGRKALDLTRFTVRTTGKPALSAVVGGRRVTIISLSTRRAAIAVDGTTLRVTNVVASLNRTGAAALNRFFGVRAFRNGLRLGTVRIDAAPEQVVTLAGGTTSLAVDGGTASALAGAGITPAPAEGATFAGGTFGFPILTGSRVASDLATGTVGHTGAISLTKGATTVTLSAFDIRLDATPSLFARLGGDSTFAEVADLELGGATVTPGAGTLTVGGVRVTLTKAAVDVLNAAFGTSLPAGTPLGTAAVAAQL